MPAASTASLSLPETVLSPRLVVLTLGGERMLTSWGANCVALASAAGTLVVDPMIAPAHARLVEEALRRRGFPEVRHVVLTHHHTDHALGAAWFAARGAAVVAHVRCAEEMAAQHPAIIAARRGVLYFATIALLRELLTIPGVNGTLPPSMLRLFTTLLVGLLSGLHSRRDLVLENLALRQQLATVLQKHQPRIRLPDRLFWILLRRLWSKWADTLVIVKPKTVVSWHRAGFSVYWKCLSRPGRRPGRPSLGRQIRDLVRRMATENGWGAPRIHGELLKLGFQVSERTVSRYLRRHRRRPENRQSWLTFLRNHREIIVAMDFFVVPTATFRLLYVWFATCHSRRQVVHWAVTPSPTAPWVVQQLREAFPFDDPTDGQRFLLFDRDSIFSAEVTDAATSMTLEPVRTSYHSPWQNGIAERLVGSVRRELLDHVIVLHQQHLQRLLREYWAYYQQDRTHLGIGKDAPVPRPMEQCSAGAAPVHAAVRVGGLHHRYSWRAAA